MQDKVSDESELKAYSAGMKYLTRRFPPCIARSALQCRLANGIIQLHYASVLILVLVTSGLLAQARATPAALNKNSVPAVGKLKVWVPAGIIGDNYWVYINGDLTSAPPHGPTNPRSPYFMTVSASTVGSQPETRYGWDLFTKDGVVLSMRHEEYDHRLSAYLKSASGDELRVFRPFELSLAPGTYTVELAILSKAPSYYDSTGIFPFVITRKYVADVQSGQTTQLYPGVPDYWYDPLGPFPVRAFRKFCTGSPEPDSKRILQLVSAYMDDPVVRVLRRASASFRSPSTGVVVLNMPSAQGGPRQFDASQIRHIAATISANHVLPTHRDVADCQRLFPQYHRSYGEFDKMIDVVGTDIESFRKLAADLERDR
ncbi:MAG TPA: hypothetical protein VIT19_11655 [Pyrinomonadaceae bacterium]